MSIETALRCHLKHVGGHCAQIVLLPRIAGAMRTAEIDDRHAQSTAEHVVTVDVRHAHNGDELTVVGQSVEVLLGLRAAHRVHHEIDAEPVLASWTAMPPTAPEPPWINAVCTLLRFGLRLIVW